MTAAAFVDTNVLLYAVSRNPAESAKRLRAREILAQEGLATSAQVLQEFYVQATRATAAHRMTHHEAVTILAGLRTFTILPVTAGIVFEAIRLHHQHRISYWDAAIIAAAREAGAPLLYSEDLSHGQDYGNVVVQNPFRRA
ncbi:MAG: PIN domain-containing protein [Planctomycetes bacterium]|nr:PIN domain-containing protein [Planctomycetota bacterium]